MSAEWMHAEAFKARVRVAVGRLSSLESFDIHVGEFDDRRLRPEEVIEEALQMFEFSNAELGDYVGGLLVELYIPLVTSKALDQTQPKWPDLVAQLHSTPPSVVFMTPQALLQASNIESFERAFDPRPFMPTRRSLAATYRCWRNLTDPLDDGWQRGLRFVESKFCRIGISS